MSSGYSEPVICDILKDSVGKACAVFGLPAKSVKIPSRPVKIPAQPLELPVNTAKLELPAGTMEPAKGTNHGCCRKFDILIELFTELNIYVGDLKETLNNKQTIVSHEELEAISSKLPLQSIDEMVQLGILEQNKKQKDSLIYILLSIGGLSVKDFTQRILRKLMTSDVTELCSWIRDKHNFELQKLIMMDCAYSE